MVAIDFSSQFSSYGMKNFLRSSDRNESSISDDVNVDYEDSIQVVGSVLDKYDSDHKYPVYGFGVEGCDWFACNGNNDNPEVTGIDGIIQSFRTAQTTCNPSSTSKFSPLIKKASDYAKLSDDNYFILLVLTHGFISDMSETINEIIEASNHPLSIVIVGIGQSKFVEMIKLDGNKKVLTNKEKQKVSRDIVQFVSFNKYKRNVQKLAEEVLKEIPHQVEQYLYKNGIQPNRYQKMVDEFEAEKDEIELIDLDEFDEPFQEITINIDDEKIAEVVDNEMQITKVDEESRDSGKDEETPPSDEKEENSKIKKIRGDNEEQETKFVKEKTEEEKKKEEIRKKEVESESRSGSDENEGTPAKTKREKEKGKTKVEKNIEKELKENFDVVYEFGRIEEVNDDDEEE